MKTAKEFLAELERDFHMDFSGGRGQAMREKLEEFIGEHRANAAEEATTPAVAPETPVAETAVVNPGVAFGGAPPPEQPEAPKVDAPESLAPPEPEPVSDAG